MSALPTPYCADALETFDKKAGINQEQDVETSGNLAKIKAMGKTDHQSIPLRVRDWVRRKLTAIPI